MSIYDLKAITIDGDEVSLEQYKDEGFEILGFPSNQFSEQEPGESHEIKNFCTLNYGVSFQLFKKSDVRGENAHPLFRYLTKKQLSKVLI